MQKQYHMTQTLTINEATYQLNKCLAGHFSNHFNNTVRMVFSCPNDWFHAQTACEMSRLGSGYPALEGDQWTIVAEMYDGRLEEVKTIIAWDNLWPLSNLTKDLPYMTDNTGIRYKKS